MKRFVLSILLVLGLAAPAMAADPPVADEGTTPTTFGEAERLTSEQAIHHLCSEFDQRSAEQHSAHEVALRGFCKANGYQPKTKEHLAHEPYVLGAYMVIWTGLFLYLRSVRKRQSKLDGEIAGLKEALSRYDQDKRKAS